MVQRATIKRIKILIFYVVSIFVVFYCLNNLIYVKKFKEENFFGAENFIKVESKNLNQKFQELLKLKNLNDEICWEDVKFVEYEKRRRGPGELGGFFNLTDPNEISLNEEWFRKEGFYVIVSDKISVDRALPEQRPEK
jgi:hypothetical protein